MLAESRPLLSIRDLSVGFSGRHGVAGVLRGVDLDVAAGETLGIVGESGSGKSMTALSIMRLLPQNAVISSGSVHLDDVNILATSPDEMIDLRGVSIGLVFQDASTALDPLFTIEDHLVEAVRARHPDLPKAVARERGVDLLRAVGIPNPEARVRLYPHQLSGGMRQRCMIAIAMANGPRLLLADEPTSALDVTLQAEILGLLQKVKAETGAALVMITHDLGVVAEMADRIAVMYAGRIVEWGPAAEVLADPKHPYTRALLRSQPQMDGGRAALRAISGSPPVGDDIPAGCSFHPRCDLAGGRQLCRTTPPASRAVSDGRRSACHFFEEMDVAEAWTVGPETEEKSLDFSQPLLVAEGLTKVYGSRRALFGRKPTEVRAVEEVDLALYEGETLALVGESGSGKTTVGRLIMRLVSPDNGSIRFDGEDLLSNRRRSRRRPEIQMVFQDPYSSLNPSKTVRDIVAEPLRVQGPLGRSGWAEVDSLLERVGIVPRQFDRYPREFSGGQRQRIGIARALVTRPRIVVLDEPVSALDVSIQAQILNLINELQREHSLTYLFISHDLSVVSHVADRIAVMRHGRILEVGMRDQVLRAPAHPYTRQLLSAVPGFSPSLEDR